MEKKKTHSNSFCEDSIERFHKMYIDAITSKILAHQNSKGSLAPLPVPNAYPSAGSVPPSAPRMRDVSFSVSSKWNCMRYMLFTFGFFKGKKQCKLLGSSQCILLMCRTWALETRLTWWPPLPSC